MVDELFFAWAAGVFDGEGMATISVTNHGTSLYTDIVVSNNAREVTDPIHERWSGDYTRPGMGKYSIEFKPLEALKFLKDIRPYLRYRTDRIDIIIEALEALRPLYESNKGLDTPKKHVLGITEILIPFYDKLLQLAQPTKGKQIAKRTFTGQLKKQEPKLPLVDSDLVQLARIKASINTSH
jgi:hypothetical protein